MHTFTRRLGRTLVILTAGALLLAFVVLPVAASALGPVALRAAGVASDDLEVRLSPGVGIFTGHLDGLSISSGPLDVDGRFQASDARIELRDVSLTERTFGALDLQSRDITATLASGEVIHAQSLDGYGPGGNVEAIARFSKDDLTAILQLPSTRERLGFAVETVRLGEGVAILSTSSGERTVQLDIDPDGALIMRERDVPDRVLWSPDGPDGEDWRLTMVSIDPAGITVTAHFDVTAFLARYPSLLELLGGFVPAS